MYKITKNKKGFFSKRFVFFNKLGQVVVRKEFVPKSFLKVYSFYLTEK